MAAQSTASVITSRPVGAELKKDPCARLQPAPWSPHDAQKVEAQAQPTVFVIDDDPAIRQGVSSLLRSVDICAETLGSPKEFLPEKLPDAPCCLVLDVRFGGLSGLDLQAELDNAGINIPIVFITGHGDIPMSVRAMKAGAVEFLTKPFRDDDLLHAVRVALERDRQQREKNKSLAIIRSCFETLTPREQEVFALVTTGLMNKQIAGAAGDQRDHRQGSQGKR